MPNVSPAAGLLRHRVAVQREVTVGQDDNGETVKEWRTVSNVWAAIKPAGGSESFSGDQVGSTVSHMVTTRHGAHLAGYDSSWRIVYGERIFEVESVLLRDEVSGGTLEWACKETGRFTTDAEAGLVAGA